MTVQQVIDLFGKEWDGVYLRPGEQDEYILNMNIEFEKAYSRLRDTFEKDDRYFLYEFAVDSYAN